MRKAKELPIDVDHYPRYLEEVPRENETEFEDFVIEIESVVYKHDHGEHI